MVGELPVLRSWFGTPRKRHIALVAHHSGKHLAGAERSFLDTLAAIDQDKYQVTCIIPTSNPDYENAIRIHTDQVLVLEYGWSSASRFCDEKAVRNFESIFKQQQFDLVHVNTITLMNPLVAARNLGVPSILHARELIADDAGLAGLLGCSGAEIIEGVQTHASAIIANSDATLRMFESRGSAYRLYNCVDIDRFNICNSIPEGDLKVGIISSNHPKKGIEHFVSAAVLASQRNLPVSFSVFGPRNENIEKIEKYIATLPSPVKLSFEGYVSDPVDAVKQVNVVASFSNVPESFGRTLIEGMAARRPIIAFERGAVGEIVRSGVDGFIVPPGDIEKAVEAIETLSRNSAVVTAMGEAGRQRVESRKEGPLGLREARVPLRRGGRRLVLGETVDVVVEKQRDHVHVVANGVNPVRGSDRDAVAVPPPDEDPQVGAGELDARREREGPTVNAVESVGLQVVREAARATDPRDEDRALGLHLCVREQPPHRRQHRVVTASRTPPRDRALVVAHVELTVVLVLGEMEDRAGAAHAEPPGRCSRMARAIAPGRRGSPRTRVQQSTSTRVVARRSQESWPRRRFSAVVKGASGASE